MSGSRTHRYFSSRLRRCVSTIRARMRTALRCAAHPQMLPGEQEGELEDEPLTVALLLIAWGARDLGGVRLGLCGPVLVIPGGGSASSDSRGAVVIPGAGTVPSPAALQDTRARSKRKRACSSPVMAAPVVCRHPCGATNLIAEPVVPGDAIRQSNRPRGARHREREHHRQRPGAIRERPLHRFDGREEPVGGHPIAE